MNETVETITAVQALGVALSIPAGTMTMGECQDAAPAMLEHLQAMGFDIVQRDMARALAESEKRVRVLEAALTRCAEYGHAQADLGSKHHERFIDDWRDCPARSCVAARAALSEPETPR